MNRRDRRKSKIINHSSIDETDLYQGIQLHIEKKLDKAEKLYSKFLKKNPNHYQAIRHLGILLSELSFDTKAEQHFKKAIKLHPRLPDAYNNLGLLYYVNEEYDLALSALQSCLKINENYGPALNNLTRLYFTLVNSELCLETAEKAINLNPDDPITELNYTLALSIGGDIKQAIERLETLSLRYQTDDVFNQLSIMYEVSGNKEKFNENLIKSFHMNQYNYGLLSKAFEHKLINESEIQYDLGKEYDNINETKLINKADIAKAIFTINHHKKNYKVAGEYLVKYNKMRDKYISYNSQFDENFFNKLITKIDDKSLKFEFDSKKQIKNEINPVFILGMPRSGTTLVEQILASHSKVHGGGELDFIRESLNIQGLLGLNHNQVNEVISKFLQFSHSQWSEAGERYLHKIKKISKNKKYVTDKMPHNFMVCGPIMKMLPHAKIIYCYRNSLDNCFSLYKNIFAKNGHGYCYNQKKLAKHYNLHIQIMSHWKEVLGSKILFLKNEDLIENQEIITRDMLKFCNLEWEDQCLEFYKTERTVRTLSLNQVRSPINKNSLGAWKNYSEVLQSLQEGLIK